MSGAVERTENGNMHTSIAGRVGMTLALLASLLALPADARQEPLAEEQLEPEDQQPADDEPAARDAVARAREQQARQQETAVRAQERAAREQERQQHEHQRVQQLYERGTSALDEGRYERAIASFEELAAKKARKSDAALYWKAYAQQKKGVRAEALATLERLRGEYPQSRWLKDAQALELEIRQKGGEKPSVDALADDDLKIMALSGLMNGNSEEALPLLEKLVQSSKSPKLREHALFVLCQSGTPKAREIVTRIARGQGSPALEAKAIEYLGMFGGDDSRRILGEIYTQSQDPDNRRAVLHAFMVSGDKARVLQAARGEKDLELRQEALHFLGMMGANAELAELYRSETSREARAAILQGLMMAGDAKRLIEVARSEKDPELRREAVQALSMVDAPEARQFLLEILEK